MLRDAVMKFWIISMSKNYPEDPFKMKIT